VFEPIRRIALACRSMLAGMVSGVIEYAAGSDTAATAPLISPIPASSGTEAKPVSTETAMSPAVSAAATLAPCNNNARGNRSASTPPTSRSATLAMDRAPTTSPRSLTDPVRSSTANDNAIGATALPRYPVVRATASHRKRANAKTPAPMSTAPSPHAPRRQTARVWASSTASLAFGHPELGFRAYRR
jgi:hypothetical protein